jgi:hypothetical protein
MNLVALIPLAIVAASDPKPPVMPLSFKVDVSFVDPDGTQAYTWYYDHINQREAKVFTRPQTITSIYHYHNVEGCDDDNRCCTAYTFGKSQSCFAVNDVGPCII